MIKTSNTEFIIHNILEEESDKLTLTELKIKDGSSN